MSQDELWEAWEEEANAALAAKEAGTVVDLYKVSGQRRVLAILDVKSHDELDRIWMAALPMARYLEINEVLPIREYEAFADDVRQRWQQWTGPSWALNSSSSGMPFGAACVTMHRSAWSSTLAVHTA